MTPENETQATTETVAREGYRFAKFNFRTPSAKAIADNAAEGLPAPLDREALVLEIPAITANDIQAILTAGDEKAINLLLDAVNAVIEAEVKERINDVPNYQPLVAADIKVDDISWTAIANTPARTRASSGITEDMWEAFKADYLEVMVKVTGHEQVKVENAAKLIAAEFKPVRSAPDKLAKLETYLDAWFLNTTKTDYFANLYVRLSAKVKAFQTKELPSFSI